MFTTGPFFVVNFGNLTWGPSVGPSMSLLDLLMQAEALRLAKRSHAKNAGVEPENIGRIARQFVVDRGPAAESQAR